MTRCPSAREFLQARQRRKLLTLALAALAGTMLVFLWACMLEAW